MSNVFKCREGCHECCVLPPFKKDFLINHQHLVKGKGITVIEDEGHCFVMSENYVCPFLQDERCLVYDVRPRACRQYGQVRSMPCIYISKSGRVRTENEQKRIKDEWEEKRLRIKMIEATLRK